MSINALILHAGSMAVCCFFSERFSSFCRGNLASSAPTLEDLNLNANALGSDPNIACALPQTRGHSCPCWLCGCAVLQFLAGREQGEVYARVWRPRETSQTLPDMKSGPPGVHCSRCGDK